MKRKTNLLRLAALTLLMAFAGCTLHPKGEAEERAAALRLGKPFEKERELRHVTPLADRPTADQVVEYAWVNNADLEQKYWLWRAAIEQVPQDATQSTNLNIAAGTNIINGHATWGSSTVTLGNDPMTDLKWPGKLDAAAKQSLENAKAAGRRFLKAKYELRARVLGAWYDYALDAELIRLEQSNEQLLETTVTVTTSRNRAGTEGQQDVLKSENELDLSRNDLAAMQARLLSLRAVLNALLGRGAEARLVLPDKWPAVLPLLYSDDELFALATRHNPELIALAAEGRGREQAIRLARLQYVPDFNFSAGTDLMGVTQSVLGQATVPIFRYEALNAGIAQAEANLRAVDAERRQTGNDIAAEVVLDIAAIRDADRQLELFEQTILPRVNMVTNLGRAEYQSGHGSLLDVLDDERALIRVERLVANLKASRGKQLADLESITTVDLSGVTMP